MSASEHTDQRYWVGVYELGDVVPRRDPRKPNLYVAKSVSPPETRLLAMRRSKKKHWYSDYLVKVRTDLGPSRSYRTKDEATAACKRLVAKLKDDGFTVNRDTQVWTVYVIELDKAGTTKPGRGFVYVGETSLTAKERYDQHKEGAQNKRGRLFSSVVKTYGLRLRPDLAPKQKFYSSVSAKRAEREHAEKLKAKGYSVKGGH